MAAVAAPLADRAVAVDYLLQRVFDFKFDVAAVAAAGVGHRNSLTGFSVWIIS